MAPKPKLGNLDANRVGREDRIQLSRPAIGSTGLKALEGRRVNARAIRDATEGDPRFHARLFAGHPEPLRHPIHSRGEPYATPRWTFNVQRAMLSALCNRQFR